MIYLTTPYSHPDDKVKEARFVEACRISSILMKRGIVVYSPIAHCHPIATRFDVPTDWEFWKHFDKEIISLCRDGILVIRMEGWRESKGVSAEIQIAEELKLPISYADPEDFYDRTQTEQRQIP